MSQTTLTIEQAIALGIQHQQAGRYPDAEAVYRKILEVQPNHADALHLLGGLAFLFGKLDIAVDLMRRAIGVNSSIAMYHCNLGLVLTRAGKWDDAIASLLRATQLDPNFADAHYNLGNALAGSGNAAAAVAAYQRAILLRRDNAEWHSNLGNALRSLQRNEEAEAAYRMAISVQPNHAESHNNLASLMHSTGRVDEAIAGYQQALSLRPNFAEAMNNLGNALLDRGQLDDAIGSYRSAIAANPGLLTSYNNLGYALHAAGQFEEAIRACEQAVSLKPDWRLPRYQLSLTRLLRGDFKQGWADHEARLDAPELAMMCQRFDRPAWDGQSELQRFRILVHAEQGFGDAIQFFRYVPILVARGGEVIVQCQPELVRLFRESLPSIQVILRGEAIPDFDLHCPLMSLPYVMGTRLETIPRDVPYLRTDQTRVEKWSKRLKTLDGKLKVGLCVAGRRTHRNDRNRSISSQLLVPLAEAPGVAWISLQKDAAPNLGVNWTDELTDFADTAALNANLDLIVTVDTAVAHLAGALGKKVWLLLPHVPDWRWMLDREDSPWYPTMRLFRQPAPGDWRTPIAQVAGAIVAEERAR